MILQIPKRQKDKQIYVQNKKTRFKRLKCPSCTQIFQQPQRLFCGHTICNKCLQNQKLTSQHFKKPLKCSICYEQIDQQKTGPDRIAQGIIDNLQVKCSAKGCKWEGYNKQFKQHYQYECEFVPKIPQSEYQYNFYSHGAQFVRKIKDQYQEKQKLKLNEKSENYKSNAVKFNMTTDIRLLIERQAEIRDRWNDQQWLKKSKKLRKHIGYTK